MTQPLDPVADKTEYLPYAPAWTGGPRTLTDVQADLKRPIHPNFIKTKPRKNRKTGTTVELPFIEWHTAVRILDRYAPGWQYRPNAVISLDGQHVVVIAEIGIPTSDYGMVWRGATGSDEEDDTSYGDASDRAEGAAYRRAASKFGLNLASYYERGARPVPTQQAPGRAEIHAETPQRREPTSTHPGAATSDTPALPPVLHPEDPNLVTQRQLNMIYAIAGKQQILKDGVVRLIQERYHRKPDELTKREASAFIESLQGGQSAA